MKLENKATTVFSRKILSKGNAQHYLESVNTSSNLEDVHSHTLIINLYL